MLRKVFAERRKVVQAVFVDDEGVEGIAYAHSSALGIRDDALAHLQVAILVEVAMYHAGSRLNDWHLGGISHELDEFLASSWNTEVDIATALSISPVASWVAGRRVATTGLIPKVINTLWISSILAVLE